MAIKIFQKLFSLYLTAKAVIGATTVSVGRDNLPLQVSSETVSHRNTFAWTKPGCVGHGWKETLTADSQGIKCLLLLGL